MSKALIVIDLPDNLNKALEEIRVDIKANLYGVELLDWRNQLIKPMPKKKEKIFGEKYDKLPYHTIDEQGRYLQGKEDGWNECVSACFGEEE